MTDLEITRLCAQAMGLPIHDERNDSVTIYSGLEVYAPLYDDEIGNGQAMALVKKLRLNITWSCGDPSNPDQTAVPIVSPPLWMQGDLPPLLIEDRDLGRAVCLCSAEMQKKLDYRKRI